MLKLDCLVSGILRNNENVMNINLPKISTPNESYSSWITNKFEMTKE